MSKQLSPQRYQRSSLSPQQNQTSKKNFTVNSQYNTNEFDLWKQRCCELEATLVQVNSDLELASFKAKKATELEQRMYNILQHNAQLLGESDNLQKAYNQKKTEAEIWRSKYENQMNTIIGLKANYELELKKKQYEIQKNKECIQAMGEKNNFEVESTKEKLFLDQQSKLESLKQSHTKNTQLYEEQVRKLQDQLQTRDQEITELNDKLFNAKNDGETEYIRLNDEREKLRQKIQQMDIESQKQLELTRIKKDQQYNDQTLAIKKLHSNEIETYEAELYKLKNLIQSKNDEISALMQQNRLQKENFDSHQIDLKEEINILKERIGHYQEIKEEEITDLKEKLAHLHTVDICELKQNHDQAQDLLIQEIKRLQYLVAQKSEELENQIKEKFELRDKFNVENLRLSAELEISLHKFEDIQQQKEQVIIENSHNLEKTSQTHEATSEQLKNHIKFLEDQIDTLKLAIVKKNSEMDEQVAKQKAIKSTLEEDIRNLRHQVGDFKQRLENSEYENAVLCEEKDHKFNIADTEHSEQVRVLGLQIDQQEDSNRKLKGNYPILIFLELLFHKEEDCINNIEKKELIENDYNRSKQQITNLNKKIIEMDLQKSIDLEELRKKLISSNQFHIISMKESTENQIKVLGQQIEQLMKNLENKEKEINDLTNKNQKLQIIFTELEQHKDKFGNEYENKLRKVGSEIITTKNIIDIFAGSKSRYQNRQPSFFKEQ